MKINTDEEITTMFFDMLKRDGVEIEQTYDEGKEYTIKSNAAQNINNNTLTFCLDVNGSFNRIMGYVGDYFSDEVHK
jgi:hypothetical protein